MIPVEQIMTARQVASWLLVSEGALAQRRHRGDGPPYVKWGRSVRYLRTDVEEWMNGLKRTAT